jgi:hypothetical protein
MELENVINLQLMQNLQVSVTWLAKRKLVQRSEEIFPPSSNLDHVNLWQQED